MIVVPDTALRGNVLTLLKRKGFKGAEIVRCDPLNDDVVEVLFSVPDGDRRIAKTAWVCRSGSVQVLDGFQA